MEDNTQDEGEKNKAQFLQLVLSLQSSVWMLMGKIANPMTGKVEKNMEAAKATIDTLEMLKEKTNGNLSKSEEDILTQSLSQLQLNYVEEAKIEASQIYFDPIIQPISSVPDAGIAALTTMKKIKKELAGAKIVVGLSNISFGLPLRPLLNATFVALALGYGLDAAILDPTEETMQSILKTSRALLGEDQFCSEFISWYRSKK